MRDVSRKYDGQNTVLGVHREYFEEFIELKRNKRLKDLSEKCYKARKKQKQIGINERCVVLVRFSELSCFD